MTRRVRLNNFGQLHKALMTLAREGDRVAENTMRRVAPFARTAILQSSASAKPYRPYAGGTYERGWQIIRIPGGAKVANSAKHSWFVEVGRDPGKRPPAGPIRQWIKHKRFAKPPSRRRKRGTRSTTKGGRNKRGRNRQPRARAPTFGERLAEMGNDDLENIVEAIRWKIAHRGTKGRYVVKRAMPRIQRYAIRALNQAFANLLASGPR